MRVSGPVRGVIADRKLELTQDEVCRRCNTQELAPLDKRLQDALGPLKVFLNPYGTKRGRAARYEHPGIYAERRQAGPFMALNAEKHCVVTEDGITIPPGRNKNEVMLKEITVAGSFAKVTISHPLPLTKKVFRALHKIAFEMLCLQEGLSVVLDKRFDCLREYVLLGRGSRYLIIKAPDDTHFAKPSVTVQRIPGTPNHAVELRLGVMFYVDLSPESTLGAGRENQLSQLGLTRIKDDCHRKSS